MTPTDSGANLRRRTLRWTLILGFLGLLFDGYDLVVYGTVLPVFLADPSQLGPVTPELGGALGSWALVGVLIGALVSGAISDVFGRRRLLIIAYGWCAVTMGLTALTHGAVTFGLCRFLSGLGIGCLLATTGALIAELAPAGRKNLFNALVYSGIAVGSLLSALLAILLLDVIGWRGMFAVGALPLVLVLPLAIAKLPEPPAWLLARGRVAEARAASQRTGIALEESAPTVAEPSSPAQPVGFPGLFSGGNALPAILLGVMSALGLLLVYSLNTWLPVLMGRAGFTTKGSLLFLLVLNGGSVLGQLVGSRLADRFGPRPVVAGSFAIGATATALLTLPTPVGVLLVFVAAAGLGTSGTQTLIYGFVANRFRSGVRGAAVAWCAGFGRLGGIGGPVLGGLLVGSGLAVGTIFGLLAGLAAVGVLVTLLVPLSRAGRPPGSELRRAP